MSKNKNKKKDDELENLTQNQKEQKQKQELQEKIVVDDYDEKVSDKLGDYLDTSKANKSDTEVSEKKETELTETNNKEDVNNDVANKDDIDKDVKIFDKNNAREVEDDKYSAEIEELKKSNQTLLEENQTLTEENKTLKSELLTKEDEFGRGLEEIKINNAVEIAIREANGKNVKAIKALINFNQLSLDASGEVYGLTEQIDTLKSDESSSFLFEEKELILKGVTPVSSAKTSGISVADFQKMSYKERLELYNKDASLYKNLKY